MQLKTMKGHRPCHVRMDDYDSKDDTERQTRVKIHRQRIQWELKRHKH